VLRERQGQPSYQASASVSSRSACEAENARDVEARVAGRRPEETGPGFQIQDHLLGRPLLWPGRRPATTLFATCLANDVGAGLPMLRERQGQLSYQASASVSSRSACKWEKTGDVEDRVAGRRPEETGPGFQIPDHRLRRPLIWPGRRPATTLFATCLANDVGAGLCPRPQRQASCAAGTTRPTALSSFR
jgi:hypothetical protein